MENDLFREGFLANNIRNFYDGTEKLDNRVDSQAANSKVKFLSSALVDCWEKQNSTIKKEFDSWCEKQFWLEAHSIFMELKVQNNNLPWWEWPEKFTVYDKQKLASWKKKN